MRKVINESKSTPVKSVPLVTRRSARLLQGSLTPEYPILISLIIIPLIVHTLIIPALTGIIVPPIVNILYINFIGNVGTRIIIFNPLSWFLFNKMILVYLEGLAEGPMLKDKRFDWRRL